MSAVQHKILLYSFFLFLSFSQGWPIDEETYPCKIASYQIDVILNVDVKKLHGKERLTFFNSTRFCVDTLFLHLYPNAFSSDTTVLMRESPFSDRIKGEEKYRGFIEVEKIRDSFNLDLTERKIIDETIMKLPLVDPLLPQQQIELEIEFTVKLPQTLVRMGYWGDDFMIAQWFPKMAVLEEDGTWNAHQYHFNSEFYADFGDYQVSITLPSSYQVGATGYLEKEENSDSTKTLIYYAECVHDFAWAASPDYRITKRVADGIEVTYIHKAESGETAELVLDYAEFALRLYGSLFGKYHYDHFTMVDAKVGRAGGAMEYPTLITIPTFSMPADKVRLLALVVFHETAHQWWYGMVASNEFEEAWLDEGFAEYSQKRALEEKFGDNGDLVDFWWIKLSDVQLTKMGYLLNPQIDPIVTRSWEFRDQLAYRSAVYYKTSLILETLRNYLGNENMEHLLKEYFHRYQFKHPHTDDFIKLVNEFEGVEVTNWLEPLFYGTDICDYEVRSIESILIEEDQETSAKYVTKVELARLGDAILPVEVEIELENGERIRQNWDGERRWHKIQMETESKIKSATIDPEEKIALEINVNNNSLTVQSSDNVMMKLAGECLFWLENWMHLITCF